MSGALGCAPWRSSRVLGSGPWLAVSCIWEWGGRGPLRGVGPLATPRTRGADPSTLVRSTGLCTLYQGLLLETPHRYRPDTRTRQRQRPCVLYMSHDVTHKRARRVTSLFDDLRSQASVKSQDGREHSTDNSLVRLAVVLFSLDKHSRNS